MAAGARPSGSQIFDVVSIGMQRGFIIPGLSPDKRCRLGSTPRATTILAVTGILRVPKGSEPTRGRQDFLWPCHLAIRMPASQAGHAGLIPAEATKF